MLIPALFVIAKNLEAQPRCPSTGEWVKKEYYSAIKNEWIINTCYNWMNLQRIVLSEKNQSQKVAWFRLYNISLTPKTQF